MAAQTSAPQRRSALVNLHRRGRADPLNWTALLLGERRVHNRQRVLPLHIIYIGDSQNALQLLRRNFHGSGRIGLARRRLRKRR